MAGGYIDFRRRERFTVFKDVILGRIETHLIGELTC